MSRRPASKPPPRAISRIGVIVGLATIAVLVAVAVFVVVRASATIEPLARLQTVVAQRPWTVVSGKSHLALSLGGQAIPLLSQLSSRG